MGESESSAGAVLRLLQLLPDSLVNSLYASNGSRDHQSRMGVARLTVKLEHQKDHVSIPQTFQGQRRKGLRVFSRTEI
jgi:hypothetical protein